MNAQSSACATSFGQWRHAMIDTTRFGEELRRAYGDKRYDECVDLAAAFMPDEIRLLFAPVFHGIAARAGRGGRTADQDARSTKIALAVETELVRAQQHKRQLRGALREQHITAMIAKYGHRLPANVIRNVIADKYDDGIREEVKRRVTNSHGTNS